MEATLGDDMGSRSSVRSIGGQVVVNGRSARGQREATI